MWMGCDFTMGKQGVVRQGIFNLVLLCQVRQEGPWIEWKTTVLMESKLLKAGTLENKPLYEKIPNRPRRTECKVLIRATKHTTSFKLSSITWLRLIMHCLHPESIRAIRALHEINVSVWKLEVASTYPIYNLSAVIEWQHNDVLMPWTSNE